MSGYYLKQVAPAWPLATIFKGMLEFMAIQAVAIGLLLVFPSIATWLPEQLHRQPPALDIFDGEPYPDERGTYQARITPAAPPCPFPTAGRAPTVSYQRLTLANAVKSTRCHSWRATQG